MAPVEKSHLSRVERSSGGQAVRRSGGQAVRRSGVGCVVATRLSPTGPPAAPDPPWSATSATLVRGCSLAPSRTAPRPSPLRPAGAAGRRRRNRPRPAPSAPHVRPARRGTSGARASRGRARPARASPRFSSGTRETTGSKTSVSQWWATIASSSLWRSVARAEGVEVVEQAPGLVLLDVEPGQPQQPSLMVAGVDDLRLDPDGGAVPVGDDVELVDVETEVVEPRDARARCATSASRGEVLVAVSSDQSRLVARRDPGGDLIGVDLLAHHAAGLQVQELAEDVRRGDLEVVRALAVGQALVQLAGLGVDEVRRERRRRRVGTACSTASSRPRRTRRGAADEQHDEGVDQPGRGVGPQRLAEQRAVGQRELQVLGDQDGVERLTRRVDPVTHHTDGSTHGTSSRVRSRSRSYSRARHARRSPYWRSRGRDADEAHDVPGDPAGERDDRRGRPVLERKIPGEAEEAGSRPDGHERRHQCTAGRARPALDCS